MSPHPAPGEDEAEEVAETDQRGDEGGEEEQEVARLNDLHLRASPEVPEPCLDPGQDPDPSGWATIDRVGAWNALLTVFTTMEEVPQQHKQAWTWAWSEVITRVQNAQEGRELDRALMWLCFLQNQRSEVIFSTRSSASFTLSLGMIVTPLGNVRAKLLLRIFST